MTWRTVKIGDICLVKRGTTITEKQAIKGSVPVVAGGISYSYKHNQANRPANVITVSASGANAGYVNFWNIPIFASDCSTVEAVGNNIDIRFIFYFLRSKQDFINQTMRSGAAQPHVYAKDIAQISLNLPTLAEQKRIAAVLDKAEEIKRNRKKEITKLDELVQSTFIEIFGDFMRVKERINLQDLIEEFRYGTSNKSSDSGHPALRIPNIAYGSLNLTELKTVEVTAEEFKRLKLLNGDLLFVRTNGNREYVGRCVVFNPIDVEKYAYDPNSYIYASYLIRARLKKNVIQPIVLQEFLSTAEGKEALRSRCKTSAGQFNINTEGLGSIPIPIFPKPLEERFILIKKSIEKQKSLCQRGMREINKTINSLQQQAFTTGFHA